MITVEGYDIRPSAIVLRLREEFPHFLICELHNEQGLSSFVATSTRTGVNGQPELIVRGGAEQLRTALSVLAPAVTEKARGGDQA